MKNYLQQFIHVSLMSLAATLMAVPSIAQENPLKIYGELYLDNRVRLENGQWSWNENRLDLQLDKKFADKAKFHSDIWLRTFGFPFLQSTEQLFNKDETSPYNIDIREAYVELYGLFTKNLDMKIGRQRIAWGTADKLNPTDNVNSYDLEDIWDFGRHLGSDAIQFKYYFRDFYVEGDYILYFRPASLPRGDWASGLFAPMELPPPMHVVSFSDSLVMPALNLKENSSYAVKIGGYAGGFNFSASYLYGRDGLPVNNYNRITPADMTGGVNVQSSFFFPRQQVIGADMAGAIGSVGIWAEAAAFFPENEISLTNDATAMGFPPVDSVILKDEPWFKFAAGLDYTFRGGHYINFQYLHGFVHERGQDNLNDYFVFNYEKYLFNEKLKIRPLTSAVVVSGWKEISGNYALIYMPSFVYLPNENTEISIGVRLIGGEGDDVFAQYKEKDEFVFSVRYKF
jgi:hypothetical protein